MKYLWLIFALGGAVTAAIVVTLSKAGIKNVHPNLAFAIQSVFILLIAWTVAAWNGNLKGIGQIDGKTWVFLILAGIISGLSSLLTFRALKLTDSSIVSPIERLSLVFAILFAVVFLRERINWQIAIGALLMAGGAVIIALAKKV